MKKFVVLCSLMIALGMAFVSTAAAQTATGDEGGLEAFAPFGKNAQILAQATCTALRPDNGFTFAVKRTCERGGASCEEICKGLSGVDEQVGNLSCFGSMHIYANSFFSESNLLGLKTNTYGDCGITACGPNYCCCGNAVSR